ncbi:hypothetical protein M758_9G162100 [Ceratodon purpureus]|nr:hypothetical protein M758_9G162100 [Ceratodon purpureus]
MSISQPFDGSLSQSCHPWRDLHSYVQAPFTHLPRAFTLFGHDTPQEPQFCGSLLTCVLHERRVHVAYPAGHWGSVLLLASVSLENAQMVIATTTQMAPSSCM